MIIALSTLDFDLNGARVVRQDAGADLDNRNVSRRMTRTATLDGGCVVYDTGYAPADRTINVRTDMGHLEWLQRIVRLYSQVRVCTAYGAFIGAPRRCNIQNSQANLEILIMEEK